ncbi:MAG: carbohydrate binding family 9 domain-containing protein [Gemmatimonadaceae bacterium]|nr:carbohydrate binding family 9 domain-containing protein [Gemmatimonadaceae bacterium]
MIERFRQEPRVQPPADTPRQASAIARRIPRFVACPLIGWLCLVAPVELAGQDAPTKSIQAQRLAAGETLTLDGRLDEGAWQRATPITDFVMQEPVEGGEPSERTEVRVMFDGDYLYIGAMLHDSEPDGVKAFQRRWDQGLGTDDRFMWILDTFGDQRNAYFFEINPAGLMGDGLLKTGQGTSVNKAWNGIWRAWVDRGAHGWSTEIRIPFRTLNFRADSDEWGINFQRTIRRRNEEMLWSGHRRSQGLVRPQNAGKLVGLGRPSQGLGLEAIPYAIAANRSVPSGSGTSPNTAKAGIDLNYSLTPKLRAGLTFNTDFAETEVDNRQVNLTRFPLVFPERRAFFLEGASVFNFASASGPNPFFSRRIGLTGSAPVPILGGAKLIGRAGAQDVGFIHMRTRAAPNGTPPEDFTVARVSRNILRESTIGLIYTRRTTDGDSLPDRHTLGADLEMSTSRFLGNRNLQFQAFAVAHTDGTPGGSGTSLSDRSVRGLRLNFPNRPWEAHVSYREFGTAYDPAVGFAPRIGLRRLQPTITYTPLVTRSRFIRDVSWEYELEYLTDMDFVPLTVDHRVQPLRLRFETGDVISTRLLSNFERLDSPFDVLRDGQYVIPVGEYQNFGYRVEAISASFRRVSGTASYQRLGFWTGSKSDWNADITARPLPGVNVTANYGYSGVSLPEGDFSTQLYRLFAGVDLTPLVSLNFNVQYDNVSRIVGTQNRLVWIVNPGNSIFFVYQQNWLNPVQDRLSSLERQGTLKVNYTHRF